MMRSHLPVITSDWLIACDKGALFGNPEVIHVLSLA